jgi:peptidoglycan/LPS O-acetylase OafA/YrhL
MSVQTRHPASARATQRSYAAALDGLRGVAIIGVLLFHTGHLAGGFLGVDLFFALSGCLITGLLLRELEATGRVSLTAFWGRRVRRLLPALVVMLVAVTLVVWATSPPDLVRTTLSDGPWVQANLVNWHLLAESAGYWDRFGSARVFGHLWSIAVEEQFYVVWPVAVVAVSRLTTRRHQAVALTAVLICVASLMAMLALRDDADPSRVYTGTDTRAFSLLLGAVVATSPVRLALVGRLGRCAGPVLAALAAAILAGWVLVDGESSPWLFEGGLFAHSLACALLIALCVEAPRSTVARALAWPPLRWVGLISYSLYLWHWPVIVWLSEETSLRSWPLTLAVGVVSTVLAAVSKVLVEDPVRYRARWARGRTGIACLALVTVSLAALWTWLPGPEPVQIDLDQLGQAGRLGGSVTG